MNIVVGKRIPNPYDYLGPFPLEDFVERLWHGGPYYVSWGTQEDRHTNLWEVRQKNPLVVVTYLTHEGEEINVDTILSLRPWIPSIWIEPGRMDVF